MKKDVCIIGSSPNILEQNNGDFIDSFDYVVRFNRSPIIGYEEHAGTKTTHRFLNRACIVNNRENKNEDMKFIPSLRNQIILHDDDAAPDHRFFHRSCNFAKINRIKELKTMLSNQPTKIKYNERKPTGGMAMISLFLNQNFQVFITGFGLEDNLSKRIIPHFFEEKETKTGHDYNYEVNLTLELINLSIIKQV